jgi:ADP-heptose:LPS heptosyltransferase/tetratricopeptide (TPR) repeat protein
VKNIMKRSRFALSTFASRADPSDLLARADALRDNGNFEAAAAAYRAVLRVAPKQIPLLAQVGNCLKEAGKSAAAFCAYCELIRNSDNGDVELQLGHLLKITGNFRPALQAYQRSRLLGDERSEPEIAFAEHWRADIAVVGEPSRGPLRTSEAPLSAFQAVLACNLDEMSDRSRFQHAGTVLTSYDMRDLGRAFCEFASFGASGTVNHQAQMDFVLGSGLWPYSDMSELRSGQLARAPARQLSELALLKKLVEACLASTQSNTSHAEPTRPHISGEIRWPPQEMTAAELGPLSARLPVLIRSLYEAVWFDKPGSGKVAIETARALSEATRCAAGAVFFASDRSYAQLQLCATFVLTRAISLWLADAGSRYISPLVSSSVVEEFLRAGGNPIVERVGRGRSHAAVFHEIDKAIHNVAPNLTSDQTDLAMARLFAVCTPELRPQDLNGFLDVAAGQAPRTTALLLEASMFGKSRNESDLVSLARRLGSLGQPKLAFDVLQRIDEETATTGALVEKALLAKVVGDFAQSARLLERCAVLDPGNSSLRRELVMVLPEVECLPSIIARYRTDELFMAAARERACFRIALQEEREIKMDAPVSGALHVSDLSPELAIEIRRHPKRRHSDHEELVILGAGSSWRTGLNSNYRLLRRIDFVRARSSTLSEIVRMRVRIDGKTLGETEGVELRLGFEGSRLRHRLFNYWIDLSFITTGLHELQLYFEELQGGWRAVNEMVWVDTDESTSDTLANSLAFVQLPQTNSVASVEDRIAELPSLVLPAARTLFATPIKRMLIVRADQLGDTSQSICAMAALKEAFPSACVDALTSPGNRELLSATDLFDHVYTVDLKYDIVERRRYASIAEQARLHELLTEKQYDLAVDLSPGFETQNLLKLAGARYTAGFKPNQFQWLTFGMDIQTHDPVNRHEMVPHSAQISAFASSLISMASHRPHISRKADADWKLLETFGIESEQKYVVLHSGARLEIKRWPFARYVELARLLTEKAGLKTILLADEPSDLAEIDVSTFPEGLLHTSAQKIPFQTFDTLLALCSGFVGNDTGPKHLAALRGAPVVSVHMGQVNWNEWGQDGDGLIVARRAPCVGCGIEIAEECGKGLPCLMQIRAEEVYEAFMRLITPVASEALTTEAMQ